MDDLDRAIINQLQGGFPICDRPYAVVAELLGTDEDTIIQRVERLLSARMLTRFGPMYHAERLGGALTLCAMRVPEQEFERMAGQVNALPEVAHNYAREHEFNMWFVLATESADRVGEVIREIESRTGCQVYDMPKVEEFFVELKLQV